MVISLESMKYSLQNMAHQKTRSLLTIISIFVGITTIFIFVSFGWGLYDYVNDFTSGTSADKVTVQPKGIGAPGLDDSFALTDQDLRAVRRTAGVYEASGVYFKSVEIKKNDEKKYVFLVAYDPDTPILLELSNIKLEKGRMLQKNDQGKVILGYNYLLDKKIFSKGLDINEKINIQGKDFRVVGFFSAVGNPSDDSQIYTTNEEINTLYPNLTGYGWIIASVDIARIDAIVKDIEKSVRNSRNLKVGKEDFFVASFQELLNSYMSALNIVIGFVILIALISVLVSAINTANTMITSVLERTKEIGIIKSIGARNSEVLKIFLFESAFLGLVAGILGVALGWALTAIAGNLLNSLGWGFLSPHYSFSLFFGCVLFAVLTGAISGVIPAINASRTNIVDALRYE